MKILIEPLYTGKPSTCSSSYCAWEIVAAVGDKNPDAFFYVIVPEAWAEKEDQNEFWAAQKHIDRTCLIPMPITITDRTVQLTQFPGYLADLMDPVNPQTWDIDVVITGRAPQIVNWRTSMGRPQVFEKGTFRQLLALDDLPFLSFRDTIPWTSSGIMDLHSFAQYLASDGVIFNGLWNEAETLKLARRYLSPSNVLKLEKCLHSALSVRVENLNVSKPRWTEGEMNVVFTGRMTGTRNFKEVAELFRKQFAYTVGKRKMNFMVSTQSRSSGASNFGELGFIHFEYNDRQKFYEFLTERAHLAVNLSTVEDFSLATYETLRHGVPTIVPDKIWTSFLGPDYPFRVKGMTEAYAMVNLFEEDYAGQYAKFQKWHDDWWKGFVEGPDNRSTGDVVNSLIEAHAEKVKATIAQKGGSFRDAAAYIYDNAPDGWFDVVKFAEEHKLITPLENWIGTSMSRRPILHMLKLILVEMGFKEHLEPGFMRIDKLAPKE